MKFTGQNEEGRVCTQVYVTSRLFNGYMNAVSDCIFEVYNPTGFGQTQLSIDSSSNKNIKMSWEMTLTKGIQTNNSWTSVINDNGQGFNDQLDNVVNIHFRGVKLLSKLQIYKLRFIEYYVCSHSQKYNITRQYMKVYAPIIVINRKPLIYSLDMNGVQLPTQVYTTSYFIIYGLLPLGVKQPHSQYEFLYHLQIAIHYVNGQLILKEMNMTIKHHRKSCLMIHQVLLGMSFIFLDI